MFSDLPSMTSLRAFEAAARHSSFTKAATELNITQGAVSQHIKALEELVGLRLFIRERNAIELTEVGQEYLVSARSALTEIFTATDRAVGRWKGDVLTIACLGSYSIKCLIPKLGDFIKRHPKTNVRIRTLLPSSPAIVSDFDVAFHYGQASDWPGLIARRMGNEELFPVCAPSLLGRNGGLKKPADLARYTKIQTASPLILHDDWPEWLKHAGIPDLKFASEITCDALYQLYQVAIEGLGVAMGRSGIVRGDILSGRLVEPFAIRVPSPVAYHLVIAPERANLPKVQRFTNWALEKLIEETPPHPRAKRGRR